MQGVSNKHCLLTFFIISANIADPDEMPHSVKFCGISSGSSLFAKVSVMDFKYS